MLEVPGAWDVWKGELQRGGEAAQEREGFYRQQSRRGGVI